MMLLIIGIMVGYFTSAVISILNFFSSEVQAIGTKSDGVIMLKAYCDASESVNIEIANNGPVVTPEIAGQRFVPCFTTKEEGCGIGLSLSRQIMRLSGGSLLLLPYKDRKQLTTFVLRLG